MPGRFPVYTDADLNGALIRALQQAGWDVVRAVDMYPERTRDEVHFERARRDQRVLLANDLDMRTLADRAAARGDRFRMIWWDRRLYRRLSPGEIVARLEEIATQDAPFNEGYPVIFLNPR